MVTSICPGLLLTILISLTEAKLVLRIDPLESNLVGNEEIAPPPAAKELQDNDWVKLSSSPPLIINTRLGERVEIECEALGSPQPEIQWLRGDRTISVTRKPRRGGGSTALSKVKSRLVIECVTRKHEGFYTCSTTAGTKSVKANPTLILIEGIERGDLEMCSNRARQPPRIIQWTPTALEAMGGDLQLPCLTVGTPAPSIYWVDPQNNVLNSVRHQVSSSGTLTISHLAWSDMGEYTCVAESPEGRDEVTTFVYPVMNKK